VLSDSENTEERSDPAKKSKGIGRITYVIAAWRVKKYLITYKNISSCLPRNN